MERCTHTQPRRRWSRHAVVAASLAGAIGVSLWGVESAEAVLCKVGGGSPTHGTIDSAVDDSSCTKVKVANGTYVEYVTITRSVALSGNGPGTVIQAPGGGTIVAVSGSGVNASIERFTIRGPVPEGTTTLMGVVVDGGAEAEIRNNTISDIREDTFSGIGSNDNFDAVMVGAVSSVGTALIKGNRIQRYQKSGIVVDGIGSSAEITQNTIFGSPRLLATQPAPYGVQVSRGATAEVRANRVTDNSNLASVVQSVGILLFEAGDGVRVVNNTVSGNDTGICVKQTDNAVIERNRVSDSAFDGISLDNQNPAMTTENNTVSRNTVLRNGEGITLFSANNNAIDRNTSSNNNGAGFWVSCDDAGGGCTQVESFGNTFTENTANRNLIGYQDESSGGGTSGTANTYTDNKCAFNGEGSDPDGLCLPQQP